MSYVIEYEGLKFDEFEFRKDLPAIIHCLTAPEPHSEAEWEREEQLSSALVGWETKYSEELIEAVSDALDELVVNFCDAFLNG